MAAMGHRTARVQFSYNAGNPPAFRSSGNPGYTHAGLLGDLSSNPRAITPYRWCCPSRMSSMLRFLRRPFWGCFQLYASLSLGSLFHESSYLVDTDINLHPGRGLVH